MTTEDKFNAAVSVIRNLPKNGSYQPSHDLMLTFYGYYKQATEGWESRGPQPPFWDVVGRAKYKAWAKLGQMSKEEAMNKYVEQLNKIVETMALTDNVANFLTSMDSYTGNVEDLELCIGPTLEKMRSQPGSPFASRDTSPNRLKGSSPTSTQSSPRVNSPQPEADDEDDDFMDSIENVYSFDVMPKNKKKEQNHIPNGVVKPPKKLPNGFTTSPVSTPNSIPSKEKNNSVDIALLKAVESLHNDLAQANDRVKLLEERQTRMTKKYSSPSLWTMTNGSIAFIILWPIFVHFVLNRLTKRNQLRH